VSVQRHELHLLTGSYALDALTDDERADFEQHLARCPSCAEEVTGLRETAARLALATAVTPPPELRSRVLTAALRTRQLPPPGRSRQARAAQRHGLRRLSAARAGLTAGVLTLAAAVAFLLVTQLSTNSQLQQARASNGAIAAVLAAPDARLESLPATVGGTVTAVMSLRDGEAVVTTADIPSLPQARVYQLWVMTASGLPGPPDCSRSPAAVRPCPCSPRAYCRATSSGSPWSQRAGPPSRPRPRSSSCPCPRNRWRLRALRRGAGGVPARSS